MTVDNVFLFGIMVFLGLIYIELGYIADIMRKKK